MSLIIPIIALVFLPATAPAQTKLPDSSKGSARSYIYTIDKEALKKIYLKDK